MKSNIIQYDTIYNEIQYTILTIYYNEQWNTIYNENNMIQWTIWYNGQYGTIPNNAFRPGSNSLSSCAREIAMI